MDTALLTSTDTDSLSVLNVADRVRLGIFQCYQGYHQVALSLGSEVLSLGRDVLEESVVSKVYLITSLLKGNAEALLCLHRSRLV